MHRALAWFAAIQLGLISFASSASAQSKENYPQQQTARPITLPQYMFELHGELMFDISNDRVFKDVSMSPDVFFGITDDFTLGIEHSKTMGVYNVPGTAPLCIGGDRYCTNFYDQVAFDGKYRVIKKDELQLAVHGMLGGQSLDPIGLGMRAGVLLRWHPAPIFSLDFDPGLGIGFTNRDTAGAFRFMTAGNKEFLYLPARANIQATEALSFFGDLYFLLPFDEAGDIVRFGTNLGLQYAVTNRVDIGGEFRLPVLIHGDAYNNTGFNVRQIGVFANFRF